VGIEICGPDVATNRAKNRARMGTRRFIAVQAWEHPT
jgi:hypothetical protein